MPWILKTCVKGGLATRYSSRTCSHRPRQRSAIDRVDGETLLEGTLLHVNDATLHPIGWDLLPGLRLYREFYARFFFIIRPWPRQYCVSTRNEATINNKPTNHRDFVKALRVTESLWLFSLLSRLCETQSPYNWLVCRREPSCRQFHIAELVEPSQEWPVPTKCLKLILLRDQSVAKISCR